MTTVGWLPAPAEELFGPQATAEESYAVLTVDVPPASWLTALETARTTLSCTYFDWLSAVDEPGTGFRVSAHVVALAPVRRLLVRTTVPYEAPSLPSAVGLYAGAAWHERETHEMFGVTFDGHPGLDHLLLPEAFEGHPLRKDFVLAARVAKAWPGAKEPGESDHGGPKRRQMLPPGVPDPNEWGPLKGQLPPAPARPARGTGRAAERTAGDRPVRRTRTAAAGSAGRTAQTDPAAVGTRPGAGAEAGVRPRRTRTAGEGSASQAAVAGEDAASRERAATEGDATQASASGGPAAEASVAHEPGTAPAAPAPARPRRARSASQGSASQRPQAPKAPTAAPTETGPEETDAAHAGPTRTGPADAGPAHVDAAQADAAQTDSADARPTSPGAEPAQPDATAVRPARRGPAARSPDAPWHRARPAFDEPRPEPEPTRTRRPADTDTDAGPGSTAPADSTPADGPPEPPVPDRTDGGTPDDPAGGPR